jgi:hypothetical protein
MQITIASSSKGSSIFNNSFFVAISIPWLGC